MKIDAVVLAARKNTGKLAGFTPEEHEANIDIAGKPMLSYILDVFEKVPQIARAIVVGQLGALSAYSKGKVVLTEPGDDLIENVKLGIAQANTEFVIVSSSDIPLVTEQIVNDFIKGALDLNADFVYPVAVKEDCVAKYPTVQRTYAKIKGTCYTGGNMFLVKKDVVEKAWPLVDKMIEYRKSPLKMASFFGPGFLIGLFLGASDIPKIEKHVSKLIGIKARALVTVPEISVDVDKPQDLELVRTVLGK